MATQLNRLFQADEFSGLYFTLLYGVLHLPTGRFDYCSGGHPPLVRLPADGGPPEFHAMESFPIAFVPDVEYEQRTLQLAAGDRLFLYSDGVLRPDGSLFLGGAETMIGIDDGWTRITLGGCSHYKPKPRR